jgi:predicted methyltransferase
MLRDKARLLMASLVIAGFIQAVNATDVNPALTQAIENRSDEERARDGARHPAQTLTFFRVEPGMTVAEVLPGEGWYTRILANYLGGDGILYGVNYVDRMWPMFSFATDEWTASRIASTAAFTDMVSGFTDNGIKAEGFTFNTVPPQIAGTVDRVLLVRALHNLNRFESQAGTRSQALASIRSMLRDDGLVGVVQHRAQDSSEASGADGSRGYLREAEVITMFEEAGFELVATSEINANPKDQPTAEDIVWRLPPTLRTSDDDPKLRAAMVAIGESDRMTLLFRKAP